MITRCPARTSTPRTPVPAPGRRSALAALALAASLTACQAQQQAAALPARGQTAAAGGDAVIASWGDQKVTVSELDQKLARKLYDIRKEGLEELINERLVEAEAKKRKLPREDFLKTEITDKVGAPTEEEIKGFFGRLQADGRLPPGATIDQLRSPLTSSLKKAKEQEGLQSLLTELRRRAQVKVALVEPRVQIEALGPGRGPAQAAVTIVTFSDFQCPYCQRGASVLDEVVKRYGSKVRVVFRHYPLPSHAEAPKAAEASLCAGDQGKFWEYHDKLFANQRALEVPRLKEYAGQVTGLDAAKFSSCLDSGSKAGAITRDLQAGEQAGVNGTPAFFINGRLLSGARPVEDFAQIIDNELSGGTPAAAAAPPAAKAAPAPAAAPRAP